MAQIVRWQMAGTLAQADDSNLKKICRRDNGLTGISAGLAHDFGANLADSQRFAPNQGRR
jgi:hypothetical protein